MSKPSSIQRAIDSAVSNITSPEQVIALLVASTAKKRGLILSKLEADRVAAAVLGAKGDSITVDLDPPCGFGETEAEAREELHAFLDVLIASVPEIEAVLVDVVSNAIPEVLRQVADEVGNHLTERSVEHIDELRKAHATRAETVERLWGETIKQLDLLRELVIEWGHMAAERRQGAYAKPNTSFALSRLVSRAYEIVGEILVLIRSGYADGALARWRSLHEVCVIAMFLAHRQDRCAEMYLSHHCIEELRLLQVDKASGTAKAVSSYQDRYQRGLLARKAALVVKYGTSYAKDNGWAAVDLGRSRVTFKDLEAHIGLDTLRRGYERANSTVHGGALATLTRVSLNSELMDDTQIPPAYGCETAANYAAASLSMLVAELCLDTENADLLTMCMVIANRARMVRGEIRDTQTEIAGNTPRARMLERRAEQRTLRGKSRPRIRR